MFTGIDPGEVRHPALWTLGAEAQALGRLAAEIDLGAVDELVAALYDAPMIVLAGVGKSGHVARRAAAGLAAIGLPALFLHPADAMHGDLGLLPVGVTVVALSRGGEGADLARILAEVDARDGISALVTARPEGPLADAADIILAIPDMEEAWGRVPTTSAVLQAALLDAVLVSYAERHELSETLFVRHHPGGAIGAGRG